MASIYKRKRKRPIPDGAQTVTSRGKRYAKWTDGRGKSRRAPLSDDGKFMLVESKKWYYTYVTAEGERKPMAGTEDYEATKSIARQKETEEAEYAHGVRDKRRDRLREAASKPLKAHLEEFEQKMNASGVTPEHITETISMIRKIAEEGGIIRIDQITAERVNGFADAMRRAKKSPRTIHKYLTAIKSFSRWLVAEGKLIGDPLVGVKKPSPRRQRERRILLPQELRLLQRAARTSGDRYGMSGEERAMLYDFAIQTGLRAGEIRSLKCTQLHLEEDDVPFVRVAADATKNRKEARQYLDERLAAQLRECIKTKHPSAAVFPLPNSHNLPAMLREDVELARTAWLREAGKNPVEYRRREQSDFLSVKSHAGQHLDFHALRHTCGAWAAKAGAHPKEVQSLMRHSSITLTMDTYGHLFPGQAAATVRRLSDFYRDGDDDVTEAAALRKTGTDDVPVKMDTKGQRAVGSVCHGESRSSRRAAHARSSETATIQSNSTSLRMMAHDDTPAGVAELADAPDSKSGWVKPVRVRVPPPALSA
jgi:integrase